MAEHKAEVTFEGSVAHIVVDAKIDLQDGIDLEITARMETLNEVLGVIFTPMFEKIRAKRKELKDATVARNAEGNP